MVADHVHHRGVRAPCVVEIGEAVCQPGSQVEKRHRGASGHAAESVCCARTDALEQAEHRTNAADGIQRRDERHLRRARVREADVDASVVRGGQYRLRTVHRPPSCAVLAIDFACQCRERAPQETEHLSEVGARVDVPCDERAIGHAQDERRELAGQSIGEVPIERIEQHGQEHPNPLEGELAYAVDDRQGRGIDLSALERDDEE